MLLGSKQIIIKINRPVAWVKMLPVCESVLIIISCPCSGTNSRLGIKLNKHLRGNAAPEGKVITPVRFISQQVEPEKTGSKQEKGKRK